MQIKYCSCQEENQLHNQPSADAHMHARQQAYAKCSLGSARVFQMRLLLALVATATSQQQAQVCQKEAKQTHFSR